MRKVWILIVLVGVVLGAMLLMARGGPGEWTTSSPEALAAFEKGLEAQMKMYNAEASAYYETALQLDADFVAAKLALMQVRYDNKLHERLAAELAATDLTTLTAREQFLVRYRLARVEGRSKEAEQILKAFLDVYPDDPWGLDAFARLVWDKKSLEKASKVYRRLLAADPNWVLAQNRLGYVAMAQGRFDEAEELFRTYTYIAPDQANPHDSMGELLTVLGRYDEARSELEHALEIKPDFCPSFQNLVEVEILEGRPEEVEPIIQRAEAAGCGGRWVGFVRCEVAFWGDYLAGDYDGPWREERSACVEKLGGRHFLIHRMAALTGRRGKALAVEARYAEGVSFEGREETAEVKFYKGFMYHLKGVRLLAEGDVESAIELMTKADRQFLYWGQDESILKLFNRLNLACAYELAGERRKVKTLLGEVAEVNPPFAGFYGDLLESFRS